MVGSPPAGADDHTPPDYKLNAFEHRRMVQIAKTKLELAGYNVRYIRVAATTADHDADMGVGALVESGFKNLRIAPTN